MITHQSWHWRTVILIASLLMLALLGLFWQIRRTAFVTGQSVAVDMHPYHQLTYTKLATHGGDFTGDVYLLDTIQRDITQLTQGGTTNALEWVSGETLLIHERPSGSVVNNFALNVQNGTAHPIPLQNQVTSAVTRSPDGQLLITEIVAEDWQTQGHMVIALDADSAETMLTIPDARRLPQWLPDSKSLVYDTSNNQICIHQIATDERECIAGLYSALSPSITPVLVAYVVELNAGYQLCVTTIASNTFDNIQCYDRHSAPMINLHWRP